MTLKKKRRKTVQWAVTVMRFRSELCGPSVSPLPFLHLRAPHQGLLPPACPQLIERTMRSISLGPATLPTPSSLARVSHIKIKKKALLCLAHRPALHAALALNGNSASVPPNTQPVFPAFLLVLTLTRGL